jgi:hypothetical protein
VRLFDERIAQPDGISHAQPRLRSGDCFIWHNLDGPEGLRKDQHEATLETRVSRVRAQGARGLMLNDDGVRRLAVAVLQQSVADLQGPIPEFRRCAAAFMAQGFVRRECLL